MGKLQTVGVYLDFISPYSYLAWVELRRLERTLGFTIAPRPILFAGLLNAHGTLGPAEVEAKRRFVFVDALRKAALLNIPLAPPYGHPFNPLLALRLSLAANAERADLVDLLYRATWEDGINVSDPVAVRAALEDPEDGIPQLDIDALWRRAHSSEIKSALRTQTDIAITRGVFGVPTMIFKNELYWGVDNIEALQAALAGRELVTEETRARWQGIRPLAQRNR